MGALAIASPYVLCTYVLAAQSTASANTATSVAEVDGLRRKVEAAEMALRTVQQSATEAVERGAVAASEHQRAMLRLHDEVSYKEGLKWQGRLATMEQVRYVSGRRGQGGVGIRQIRNVPLSCLWVLSRSVAVSLCVLSGLRQCIRFWAQSVHMRGCCILLGGTPTDAAQGWCRGTNQPCGCLL